MFPKFASMKEPFKLMSFTIVYIDGSLIKLFQLIKTQQSADNFDIENKCKNRWKDIRCTFTRLPYKWSVLWSQTNHWISSSYMISEQFVGSTVNFESTGSNGCMDVKQCEAMLAIEMNHAKLNSINNLYEHTNTSHTSIINIIKIKATLHRLSYSFNIYVINVLATFPYPLQFFFSFYK